MDAITRYENAKVAKIWSDREKFHRWAEVEIAAAAAQHAPDDVLFALRNSTVPTPEKVAAREEQTRHDVVAFLDVWRSKLPAYAHPWLHRNMTSSDLVDTANAGRMADTIDFVCDQVEHGLMLVLARHALAHWDTVRVGRTHGQTAEVTTWGHRMAEIVFGLERATRRLRTFRADIAVGKLSGPVGDFKRITPHQERAALSSLNLGTPQVASQVLMRDTYVDFVYGLAQLATVIEALALEIRLSSRSDTAEVAEGFGQFQRGSSAMPHKRNPIVSENLCGLARLVRAQVDPVMQGVALHHERDISHSSVERVALETAATLTATMVDKAAGLIPDLFVDVKAMKRRAQTSPELLTATAKDYLIANGINPDTAWNLVANAHQDYVDGETLGYADALNLSWASVTRHGPLPGVSADFKPEFVTLMVPLSNPIEMVGQTAHVRADLEVFAGY